jgi:hypothetical protein
MKKDRAINQALRRAVISQVPDVYSRVVCQPVRREIESFIVTQAKHSPKFIWRLSVALMSITLFVFGAWFMLLRVDSIIGLDVNPSIEIQVNRLERVISLQPLNSDAIPIVSGIGYRNLPLDQVVNAVISSMYYHGYLESPESAILITVDNKDSQRASALELSLTIEINKLTSLGDERILSQTVHTDTALAQRANRLGVSRGVMQLILEAQIHHPQISTQTLSQLPVGELFRLAQGIPPSSEQQDTTAQDQNHPEITPPVVFDGSGPKPLFDNRPFWQDPLETNPSSDDDDDDDFDDFSDDADEDDDEWDD